VNPLRRRLLAAVAAAPATAVALDRQPGGPRPLQFPRDFGAHPDDHIEWWYLTGLLEAAAAAGLPGGQPAERLRLGLQLTFFRVRPAIDPDNPSRFAAHQLVLAHAALADPRRGTLLHEERIARAGFSVAAVSSADTAVEVDRWRLARDPASGVYRGSAQGAQFGFELTAAPTQPLLLQGDGGYSRKTPAAPGASESASRYYTEPQLALEARVRLDGAGAGDWSGRAWLDHEWSGRLLPPQAAGWDWVGFNLDDGAALTAFRIRDAAGGTSYAYASLRAPGHATRTFAPSQVRFEPLQQWVSPRTRARYPVAQRITAGERTFETRPLMPDQELDARASSGLVYWEGASDLLEDGQAVGSGYLEMTGYAGPAPGSL
jgi:predicted secreted hydrolase